MTALMRRRGMMKANSEQVVLHVRTITGTLIYSDQDVASFYIPVDTSNAAQVEVCITIKRTGIVADGVITYDDIPQPHNGIASVIFSYYAKSAEPKTVSYQYNQTVNPESFNVPNTNAVYTTASYGSRASFVSIVLNNSILLSNGLNLALQNANRRVCRPGLFMEFEYEVTIYE